MAHIAVVGSGPAGLATSLFLARRGHGVTLVEQDAAAPPDDPELCFDQWRRRGVAQARQPHLLLGRSSELLLAEAPDVLRSLADSGPNLFTNAMDRVDYRHVDDPYYLCSRRLPFEAQMRREALRETNVHLVSGVEVESLVVRGGDTVTSVKGVRLADGQTVDADLVVDCAGRFSPIAHWLQKAGLDPLTETGEDCDFCYITRWYRLKPGQAFPIVRLPVRVATPFAMFMCFPADRDVFGLTVTVSMRDPLRAAPRDPATFDRIVAALPQFEPWLARADPIGPPHVLGRIENRWRSLLRDGRPSVGGLALVGDSAIHTNPTMGLGITLGYLQAQQLANMASVHEVGSLRFSVDYETWRAETLAIWFDTQVAADRRRLAVLEATLTGQDPVPPTDQASRFNAALQFLSGRDPIVARAFIRMSHMCISPLDLAADPIVKAAVAKEMEGPSGVTPPQTGLSRETFERLVGPG